MKYILFIIALFFVSCKTERAIHRKADRLDRNNASAMDSWVAKNKPVRIEEKTSVITKTEIKYIKGDTLEVAGPTVYVKADCDTVKLDSNGNKIAYWELPKERFRIDSFITTITDSIKVEVINAEKEKQLTKELMLAEAVKKNLKLYAMIVTGILILSFIIWWLKRR